MYVTYIENTMLVYSEIKFIRRDQEQRRMARLAEPIQPAKPVVQN